MSFARVEIYWSGLGTPQTVEEFSIIREKIRKSNIGFTRVSFSPKGENNEPSAEVMAKNLFEAQVFISNMRCYLSESVQDGQKPSITVVIDHSTDTAEDLLCYKAALLEILKVLGMKRFPKTKEAGRLKALIKAFLREPGHDSLDAFWKLADPEGHEKYWSN